MIEKEVQITEQKKTKQNGDEDYQMTKYKVSTISTKTFSSSNEMGYRVQASQERDYIISTNK